MKAISGGVTYMVTTTQIFTLELMSSREGMSPRKYNHKLYAKQTIHEVVSVRNIPRYYYDLHYAINLRLAYDIEGPLSSLRVNVNVFDKKGGVWGSSMHNASGLAVFRIQINAKTDKNIICSDSWPRFGILSIIGNVIIP